jgi:hypothetical protein
MSEQNIVGAFLGAMGDKTSETQKVLDNTSSESTLARIEVPGRYRLKVKSLYMKKKDGTIKKFPAFEIADGVKSKGDLRLNLIFEVVDGTEVTPKGATIFYSLTVVKAPTATPEKVENTMKFMKPVVCTLLGTKDIKLTQDFLVSNLSSEFDDAGKMLREHNMKRDVMGVVELKYDEKTKKEYANIVSISPVREGDKSTSTKVAGSATEAQTNTLGKASEPTEPVVTSHGDDLEPTDEAHFQVEDA